MKKFLGFGMFICGIAGIAALVFMFVHKPESYIKTLDKGKWHIWLVSDDGWFDTKIPIIANQNLTFKTQIDPVESALQGEVLLAVRIEDQVIYVQRRKKGIGVEFVEWNTKSGFSDISPDYKGNLFLKFANVGDQMGVDLWIESSLITCTNPKHEKDHKEAKEWWDKQVLKLTE